MGHDASSMGNSTMDIVSLQYTIDFLPSSVHNSWDDKITSFFSSNCASKKPQLIRFYIKVTVKLGCSTGSYKETIDMYGLLTIFDFFIDCNV